MVDDVVEEKVVKEMTLVVAMWPFSSSKIEIKKEEVSLQSNLTRFLIVSFSRIVF